VAIATRRRRDERPRESPPAARSRRQGAGLVRRALLTAAAKEGPMDAPLRRPLVAGNWKMNGLAADKAEQDRTGRGAREGAPRLDLMIWPPATLLVAVAEAAKGSRIALGAQDCRAEPSGAFTGDIAAERLADAGASAVIVGHSERRAAYGESDATV